MWTGPVTLTLVLSVLALLMSGLSLGWQIISWRRSGPRVKVKTINGVGGIPVVDFVGIQATNEGRLSTEVTSFGFLLANNQTIQAIQDAFGMPVQLPQTLNPGGQASIHYSTEGLHSGMQQAGNSGAAARPYVETGHGRIFGPKIHLGEWVDR
jgi:hypothetical protein